jgi:hypothetical protein
VVKLIRALSLTCVGLFSLVAPLSAEVAVPAGATAHPTGSAQPQTLAQTQAPTQAQTLARRIAEATHIGDTAKAFRKMLLAPTALPDCGGSLDEETAQHVAAAWRTAVTAGFDEAAFAADIEAQLAAKLPTSVMTTWLAFRQTDAGRSIHAAETPDLRDISLEQSLADLKLAGDRLQADPARQRVLQKIAAVSGGVEASIDAMLSVSLGTALGSNAAMPKGQPRLDTAEVIALVEAQRPVIRAALADMMMPMLGHLYRDVPLPDLRRYLAELSSEEGRQFISVFRSVFGNAIKRQGLNIGAMFAKEYTAIKA